VTGVAGVASWNINLFAAPGVNVHCECIYYTVYLVYSKIYYGVSFMGCSIYYT
jgi:hypothetical protein